MLKPLFNEILMVEHNGQSSNGTSSIVNKGIGRLHIFILYYGISKPYVLHLFHHLLDCWHWTTYWFLNGGYQSWIPLLLCGGFGHQVTRVLLWRWGFLRVYEVLLSLLFGWVAKSVMLEIFVGDSSGKLQETSH